MFEDTSTVQAVLVGTTAFKSSRSSCSLVMLPSWLSTNILFNSLATALFLRHSSSLVMMRLRTNAASNGIRGHTYGGLSYHWKLFHFPLCVM